MNTSIARIAQVNIPAANLLIKTGSSGIKYADLCGASDTPIGVAANTCLAGELVTIRPLEDAIFTLTASGPIAAEVSVELSAGGKVATASEGTVIGRSVTSAASGERVQVAVGVSGGGDGGGGGGTSAKITVSQTAHGFVAGEVLYHTGTAYAKARANAVGTSLAVGVVESAETDSFVLVTGGIITLTGLTPGELLYLSPATAGALTAAEPVEGDYHVAVMRCVSGTQGVVEISDPVLVTTITSGMALDAATLTYAAVTNIVFAADQYSVRNLTLTGNVVLTASGYTAGRNARIRITADGTQRTIETPIGWVWGNTRPASLTPYQSGMLVLQSFGSAETDTVAHWYPETGRTLAIWDDFGSDDGELSTHTIAPYNTPSATWAKLAGNDIIVGSGVATGNTANYVCNTGAANGYARCTVTLPATTNAGTGITLRYVDANNGISVSAVTATGLLVRKLVSGTGTDIVTVGNVANFVAGTTHVLELLASGTTIKAWYDGELLMSQTITDHTTATLWGIAGRNTSGDSRTWDDWKFWTLS